MKLEAYADYDSRQVALAESALFTIWPNLEPWHDDLVLVGGLVPRYICGDTSTPRQLPRPVTLDADIGIALGASAGGMSSLQFALLEKGFYKATSPEGLIRYEKEVGDYSVPVDFRTDAPPHTQGSATVDDIVASVLPGINRALATARTARVTGADLAGDHQTATLRVCEVGPFLALKLRAFLHREQPKDAFDILYTLLHYDRGPAAAVAAFADEVRAENTAGPDALLCLQRHFDSEASLGPSKAAQFFPGQPRQVNRRTSAFNVCKFNRKWSTPRVCSTEVCHPAPPAESSDRCMVQKSSRSPYKFLQFLEFAGSADADKLFSLKLIARNSANPLLAKIQGLFSRDLALENDYLRQENKILRSKLGVRVPLTEADRRVLVQLGLRIRTQLREVISIAKPETL